MQVAPVIDTVISPKETLQVHAWSLDKDVRLPDGLDGTVAVSPETVHPFVTISECACTMHKSILCLLVSNETDDEVV